ncbi:MAG TPA: hypothetical protein VEC17_02590 [Candidatus Binatia bacterium]|nr:hypothetical protein [Candidatus Binatia bacterium]
MTLTEKTKKLLDYSVILKADDKKNWLELLPNMTEKQVQTLYNVLVDEVKAWKKEGILIIQDAKTASDLLPNEPHGASLNSLKAILETSQVPNPLPQSPEPQTPKSNVTMPSPSEFSKELDRELHTAELTPPHVEIKLPAPEPEKPLFNRPKTIQSTRNKFPRLGLNELKSIRSIDDLKRIEPAHLRQGPLVQQLAYIKNKIAQLAREKDLLPVNIIPTFEKSPLFQIYLKAGALLIERNYSGHKFALEEIKDELESAEQDSLSQEEFEAIADFKKDLETMAGL